jgi:hypothetical protein
LRDALDNFLHLREQYFLPIDGANNVPQRKHEGLLSFAAAGISSHRKVTISLF